MTLVGTFLLMLIVLTPVWDCVRLLYSQTYVYFLGRSAPVWASSFCGIVVLFFIMAMLSMEGCGGRKRAKTDHSFMYLFTSVITTLGLGLVLFSEPLVANSRTVYNELMMDCGHGAHTEPLSAYYNVLLNIRKQPDCINKASIENCSGFHRRDPYTGFLKELELGAMCSGFCYKASGNAMNTTPPVAAVLQTAFDAESAKKNLAEALQERTAKRNGRTARQKKHADSTEGVFLLSADQTLSRTAPVPVWDKLPRGVGNTVNNMMATGWMNAYPPTLFTNANFKTTCEGAAARQIRFSAIETGNLMYMQGAALLIVSVLLGFLKIATICRRGQQGLAGDLDGNGQYQDYETNIKELIL